MVTKENRMRRSTAPQCGKLILISNLGRSAAADTEAGRTGDCQTLSS